MRGESVSESGEKSNRLIEGEAGIPLGYCLSAQFYPPITLDKKLGYEFAATVSDYIEPDSCEFESTGWELKSEKQGLTIQIGKNRLSLLGENPSGGKGQEWYEHRYHEVLLRFSERFQPQIALNSTALIRQLFRIDGDSRDFLAEHVMNIRPDRFGPLNRPIHLLGMRIAFPPYEAEWREGDETKTDKADWVLELKVESWLADPQMLFVEADANWHEPMQWNKQTVTTLVNRLQELTSYLSKVRDFLDHPTGGVE